MFDFLKSKKQKRDTAAKKMGEALAKYFETSAKECDKLFGATWPWVGLMSVAIDLDKANGNEEKVQAIVDTQMSCFTEDKPIKYCAALLLIQHSSNQADLERIVRSQGGRGRA
jgi:hypothetical protein